MAAKPTLASLQKHVDEQQAVIDVMMKRLIDMEVKVSGLPTDPDFMSTVIGQVITAFQQQNQPKGVFKFTKTPLSAKSLHITVDHATSVVTISKVVDGNLVPAELQPVVAEALQKLFYHRGFKDDESAYITVFGKIDGFESETMDYVFIDSDIGLKVKLTSDKDLAAPNRVSLLLYVDDRYETLSVHPEGERRIREAYAADPTKELDVYHDFMIAQIMQAEDQLISDLRSHRASDHCGKLIHDAGDRSLVAIDPDEAFGATIKAEVVRKEDGSIESYKYFKPTTGEGVGLPVWEAMAVSMLISQYMNTLNQPAGEAPVDVVFVAYPLP